MSPEKGEYKIVSDISPDRFQASVNRLIEQGFRPLGGPTVVPPSEDQISEQLFQAMIRGGDPLKGVDGKLEAIEEKLGDIHEAIDQIEIPSRKGEEAVDGR